MQQADKSSDTFRARVDSVGRFLIPASSRQRLGIEQGDELIVRVDDKGLHITTAAAALKEAQALFAKLKTPGKSMVDDLIKNRRKEAASE